jgi:Tfp pilus assembly protein PilW
MTRERPPDDSGTSLVELMVTLAIMSVLMVLFTGAVLQVFKTTSATDSLAEAQRELAVAFQRFDRELRYASWIADPGKVGSTYYVEFAGSDPSNCYQLRLAPGTDELGVLQLVSWTLTKPPAAGAAGQTIASQIDLDATTQPFTKPAFGSQASAAPTPSASSGTIGGNFKAAFQQLRVQLTTKVAAGSAQIDITFTALNSADQNTNGCSEGRPK